MWRIIVATVSTTSLSLITNQAQANANAAWFHIQPLQLGLSACFQNVVLALGVLAYKRYLLHVSWRKTCDGRTAQTLDAHQLAARAL